MDDFEKEAFEGFSKYSSATQAKNLTAEIHSMIDEKMTGKKVSRPVSGIIWLSAAASVVLIVILSMHFLTETTGTGKPGLALNADNSKEKTVSPVMPPKEEISASVEAEPDEKESGKSSLQQEISPAKAKGNSGQPATGMVMNEQTATQEKKGDAVDYNVTTAKDDATKAYYKSEYDQLNNTTKAGPLKSPQPAPALEDIKSSTPVNETPVGANKTSSAKKEEKPVIAEEAEKLAKEQDLAVTETKNNASAKQDQIKKRAKVAEADKTAAVAGTTIQVDEEKESNLPADLAYYTGGETAVKTYVINWLEKQDPKEKKELKGTYKVRLKVFANGKVHVVTFDPEKNANSGMEEPIKKALNSMDGWHPAMINGKPSESEIVIRLTF